MRLSTIILSLLAATACDPDTGRCWGSSPDWDAVAEAQTTENQAPQGFCAYPN